MTGIDDATTVDRITQRPDGQYVLVIDSTEKSIETRDDIKQLVGKLNAYTDFIVDGGLRDVVSTDQELRACIRIDLATALPEDALRAIGYAEDKLRPYGIAVEHTVVQAAGAADGGA